MGDLIFFYDRTQWPMMSAQWAEGFVAVCPETADPVEWRESARRLARHLDCKVRTGLRPRDGHKVLVAEGNDGFPLGLIDAYERDAWLRRQCVGCDEAEDG